MSTLHPYLTVPNRGWPWLDDPLYWLTLVYPVLRQAGLCGPVPVFELPGTGLCVLNGPRGFWLV